ncbi:MAG: hypothetical protein WBL63_14690 [Candidatus Acidiferrum sp.]
MRRSFTIVFSAALLLIGSARGAPAQNRHPWTIQGVERQMLVDDIAHYQFVVTVGPGQYDKIRIHRLVKERHPYQPAHPSEAVMFFPGEPTYFATLYIEPLIDQTIPRDHSIAIYLAKNDIDVWGMDYRWALVPESTTDFSFMRTWGMTTDVSDAQVALTIARAMRGGPFEPAGPLFLAGLSYGAQITYAIAANDAQHPPKLQNVKAIIPMDEGLVYVDPAIRAEGCDYLSYARGLIASGTYNYDNRSLWQMGQLAISDPHDISPFDSTLTNYQFALVVATSPEDEAMPWHFAGGYFDHTGMPIGLRYTNVRLWEDLLAHNEPPYNPVFVDVEGSAVQCGKPDPDAKVADHLDEVTVPILLIEAAGGFSHSSDYTATFTASHDVTILNVQLLSDDQQSEDFGHVDLLTGYNAEYLVWQPILHWIKTHR